MVKARKRKLIIIFLCIVIIFSLAWIVYPSFYSNLELNYFLEAKMLFARNFFQDIFVPSPDYEKIEKYFEKDREYIDIVCDYLINRTEDNIYIDPSYTKTNEISLSGLVVKIDEDNIISAIRKLLKRGYKRIEKNDGAISFCRWSSIFDKSRGIVYSINGTEPKLLFQIKIELLPEPDWYYYEEDYNEWRVLNK